MKTLNKNLLLVIGLAGALSACDMKTKMDEMHDSTLEMNKTTQGMSKSTKSMEGQTQELYTDLRQGGALEARRAALTNLIKHTDPSAKLSEAGKYFMSFDYQLWTNIGLDAGEEKRKELAAIAAREFFKDLQQFIPGGKMEANPLSQGSSGSAADEANMVASFNAIAATLHILNPKQEFMLAKNKDMKSMSMYKIIEESLIAKVDIESGKARISDYPEYVEETLFYEKEARYLLQARYNFLPAILLGRVTNIAHSKFSAIKTLLMKWDFKLSDYNTVQVNMFNLFIKGALSTEALLNKVGETPKLESWIARMFKNMVIIAPTTQGLSAQRLSVENELVEHLAELQQTTQLPTPQRQ